MNAPPHHVLVTGGAIRLGREIATDLARNRWNVTIHYNTSHQQAHQLTETLKKYGVRISLVQGDLEEESTLERLIPLNPDFPLNGLVNNASLFLPNEQDPDGLRHNMVNNLVPRKLIQRLAEQLPKGQKGKVVNVLDCCPFPEKLRYYAQSKHKLEKDTRTIANHFSSNLLVNAIALGPTICGIRQTQESFEKLCAKMPSGKPCSPPFVASCVRSLMETEEYSGKIMVIDGDSFILR
jgi:NAD(P)-dependent dehydrogenase (short-subunit alcohol dehydrogenase family)